MTDEYLDRYDRIQKLNKSIEWDEYDYERRCNPIAILFIVGAMLTGLITLIALVKSCEVKSRGLACRECHISTQKKLTEYFKSKGSKTPEEMAEAVLSTKSPRLMAAVAVVETKGTPGVRKGGYKKRYAGAFQVNAKFHGRVSKDPVEQALQAEAILTELVEDKGLVAGLNYYGGSTKGTYARTVLAELTEVPK